MKNRKIVVALFLVSTFSLAICFTPHSVYGSGCLFKLTQDGTSYPVYPVKGDVNSLDFYNYFSASGHTPFMDVNGSKIYLYYFSEGNELSLIMHHGIDFDTSGQTTPSSRENFYISGVPPGASVAQSDDPTHTWNATRVGGREFDLAQIPEGNWNHGSNSDGGVIKDLTMESGWCITIVPDFIRGMTDWVYLSGGEVEGGVVQTNPTEINLGDNVSNTDNDPASIQICCYWPSPGPLFSNILAMLPLGIFAGALIIRKRR